MKILTIFPKRCLEKPLSKFLTYIDKLKMLFIPWNVNKNICKFYALIGENDYLNLLENGEFRIKNKLNGIPGDFNDVAFCVKK